MTIDEAIKKYKEKSEFFKKTTNVSYALELEANWKLGYKKAIDDFTEELKKEYIRYKAEQLKAGGLNE